jgi:5'-nucleotidase
LGFLELEFDTHQALIGWEGQLIAMNKDVPSFEAFARMVHTLARPLENVHEIMMGTVQHTAANRNCRKEFCSEGRMVADAMLATFSPQGADIALFNGGGLRHTVEAGPIFQADLKALLPFGDQISTFDLTGKQIRETLEQALIGGGRFPHIAGLRVAWSVPVAKAPHAVIDTLDVLQEGRWQPVKDTATYTLATNSFLRKGGDGYSHFKKSASNVQDTSIKVLDVVLSYVRSRLVLDLGDDGRLQHKTTGHTGAQP